MFQLEDAAVAQSLGFETGMYEVREMPEHEQSPFRYKYLTSDPNGPARRRANGGEGLPYVWPRNECVCMTVHLVSLSSNFCQLCPGVSALFRQIMRGPRGRQLKQLLSHFAQQ